MEKEKLYQPTEEEMQQAGDMMTDEQQIEMSETRERLFKEAESIIQELGWHKKNEKTGDEYIGNGYRKIPVLNMSLGDIKDAYRLIAYEIKEIAEKTRTKRWQLENIKGGSYPGIEGMLWTESDAKRSIEGRERDLKPKEAELARLESLNVPSRLENVIYKIEERFEKRDELQVDGQKLSWAEVMENAPDIVENPTASPGALRVIAEGDDLARRKYKYLLEKVAMHPNTPADYLAQLSEMPDGHIQLMVALNPNTPVETLIDMVLRNEDFLDFVEQNPNVPDDVFIKLMQERRKRYDFNPIKYLEALKENSGGSISYEMHLSKDIKSMQKILGIK